MARGPNAQLAADMYNQLRESRDWTAADAWKGIAELLLTCQIQRGAWTEFHGCVVYRESNDFKFSTSGEANATIRKSRQLTAYLASQLGVPAHEVCARIGAYWRHPQVNALQQHNLVGHGFRSCVVEILKHFGAPGIDYEEEVDARELFRDWRLSTRSKRPMIDILATKNQRPVAMLSARWRYRHDRVDLVDEAHAYTPAAARMYSGCPFLAVVGEFNPARLSKVLDNVPYPIAAAVHFCPDLITKGLGENGRTAELKSLEWLIGVTHDW